MFGGNSLNTSGTYTSTVTNAAGCDSNITLNLTVIPNSIGEINSNFKLYPNPTKDFINVNMPIVGATLEIYNSIGQHIFTAKNNGGNMVIDLSSFPDGLYLLGVNNAQGIQINCSKIIKN